MVLQLRKCQSWLSEKLRKIGNERGAAFLLKIGVMLDRALGRELQRLHLGQTAVRAAR